jgi:hypothetical protein
MKRTNIASGADKDTAFPVAGGPETYRILKYSVGPFRTEHRVCDRRQYSGSLL